MKAQNKSTKKQKQQLVEVLRTPVAGLRYADFQLIRPIPKAGDQPQLVWERTNPVDPRAIKLMLRGHKIGYIPRILTEKLHQFREKNITLACSITGYWPQNPSWDQLHVKVMALSDDVSAGDIAISGFVNEG